MEDQLQNIKRKMARIGMHLEFFGGILDYEISQFNRIVSEDINHKYNYWLSRYMILEEEQAFIEYMLITKTD